jgi:PleD family two-component response regulator
MTTTIAVGQTARSVSSRKAVKKVVIVSSSSDVLELLGTLLDAGQYDVVFVESNAHAYSQIKRVQPQLVIVCTAIDSRESIQVLTMLKLDADTRSIPVLTYPTEFEGQHNEETPSESFEAPMFPPRRALLMN